jgi:hypothetical protein
VAAMGARERKIIGLRWQQSCFWLRLMRLATSTMLVLVGCGAPLPPTPAAAGEGLDLNDVSFLSPLTNGRALMSLVVEPLLTRAQFDAIPNLVEGIDGGALWSEMQIVSVRVDPCFPSAAPPAPVSCVPQIRLVAQPVLQGGADAGFRTTTRDATLHLFYSLSPTEFAQVHAEVWALKRLAGDATMLKPLDVHPVLARDGLQSPYGEALKAMVSRNCHQRTLSRVAFMSVNPEGFAWTFGAFNVENGQLVDDTIPRLRSLKRQGVREEGGAVFRAGVLLPDVPGDDLPVLLSESEVRLTDDDTLRAALTSALQLEHPDRSSPKTHDCASCHVASRSRRNAERRRNIDTTSFADAFASTRFDLRRVDGAADDPHAMRAFGYFGFLSALSQRTINESAKVAESLSKMPQK